MIARHDRCGTQPSAKGDGEKLRCCLIPFASGVRCVPINLFLTIRSLQSFWPKTDRSINRNRQLKRQRGAWGHFRGTLHAEREKLCIFFGLFLSHSFCRSTRCLRNLWVMATWRETVRASKNQMISHVEQRSSCLGPLNCHAKVYISSMHFARWTTASWTTSTRSKPRRNLVKDHMARPSARIIKT